MSAAKPLQQSSALPMLLHDEDARTATSSLEQLFERYPDLVDEVVRRNAVIVAFAFPRQAYVTGVDEEPELMVQRLRGNVARAYERVVASWCAKLPLCVASGHAGDAFQIAGANVVAPYGWLVGTFGAGKGGVIFAPNIVGSESWTRARELVLRFLGEHCGP